MQCDPDGRGDKTRETEIVEIEDGATIRRYDIIYMKEIQTYNLRKTIDEEKNVRHMLIFSFCNKVIQNRIGESAVFESKIQDDPIELLNQIKKKMYDPARGNYEYVILTESLKRIFKTTQEDGKFLVDYTKRLKQDRDIIKDSVGDNILHKFIENTNEYQTATGDSVGTKLKE